ncbi:MIP/aquaporin family protein [Phyllobacterium myrsinacearum]|uniref:Aquaporin n=1 Tax=Phyllobacterium myrsinacearum TaxID=28101 RepID=A0A2S9JQ66_9HYPH|nr:MIP/aquaporin family protein [Phyllobacterium myrsinacearum]PRD55325.1 aquaporin [Phyllobacterium myrsinacearum]PWV91652.1 glycerol uptake facilitator protein [Phyllobacterium myrsinacearum]RZV05723.1 glycerol uptake facilitator protein [Phyllobacterium myrsinacearum]
MHTPFIGELLGTMMLIILGDGVVAGVLLQGSKAQNAGWVAITAGWAFAVLAGVFVATSTGSPDAHINPAVTIGFAVVSGDYSKIASYIPAQLIGAFLGGVIVWLQYLPHWAKTSDAGLKLAVFCTGPAIRNTGANLLSEIIGTFVLVFVIASIFSKAVAGAGITPAIGPYMVAMLVWAIGLSLGGTTGYAINPARDLGPRIAHAVLPIAGKGGSDWGYSWIPVVGPIVGAIIAAFFIKALI